MRSDIVFGNVGLICEKAKPTFFNPSYEIRDRYLRDRCDRSLYLVGVF